MVKTLLIIEPEYNFLRSLETVRKIAYRREDGEEEEEDLLVEQAAWKDINFLCDAESEALRVEIRPSEQPIAGKQEAFRSITVDFVLMLETVRGLPDHDYRNLLFGLAHSNVGSMNSIHATTLMLERSVVFGAMYDIYKRLGKENFPLFLQTYYPDYRVMNNIATPAVVKIGAAHSGYGKVICKTEDDIEEVKSIVAMQRDYSTVEPLLNVDYDIRIQKLGETYRVFKRSGGGWRAGGERPNVEELELTPRYKMWADECAKMFGGLDLLEVDVSHCRDDNSEFIMEVNNVITLNSKHYQEDMLVIGSLALQRMSEYLGKNTKLSDPQQPAPIEMQLVDKNSQLAKLNSAMRELQAVIDQLKKKVQDTLQRSKDIFGATIGCGIAMGVSAGLWLSYLALKARR